MTGKAKKPTDDTGKTGGKTSKNGRRIWIIAGVAAGVILAAGRGDTASQPATPPAHAGTWGAGR